MSLREAETAIVIAKPTLHGRLQGEKPHFIAHSKQQLLTTIDERAGIRWITILENCGFPPRIEQAAELIIRTTVGENSISRFLNRYPMLATKVTTPLERDRMEAENPRIHCSRSFC